MLKNKLSLSFVLQRHKRFCALVSLAIASKYYGSEINQDQGADFMGGWAEEFGVGSKDLKRLAVQKGFPECNFYVDGRIEDLISFVDQSHPIIVLHSQAAKNTYPYSLPLHARVVIGYDRKKKKIIFHDPQLGPNQEISYQDFSDLWAESRNAYFLLKRAIR